MNPFFVHRSNLGRVYRISHDTKDLKKCKEVRRNSSGTEDDTYVFIQLKGKHRDQYAIQYGLCDVCCSLVVEEDEEDKKSDLFWFSSSSPSHNLSLNHLFSSLFLLFLLHALSLFALLCHYHARSSR